jgi:type IX secretion system PorP/SprF family membrane protein
MRIFILSIALLLAGVVNAQQLPQYSQYIFNGMAINPAYAGSKSMWNATASYRSQWMNVDGAPTTQFLSVDGSQNASTAYAFQLENDQAGAQGKLSMLATYAYRFSITEDKKLAFGISGGANRFAINKGLLTTADANDPLVMSLTEHSWRPDARFGVFFNTNRFYAGMSVASLLDGVGKPNNIPGVHRHLFINTGYIFSITDDIKLKPSVLVKEDLNSPTSIDVNAFVLLQDRLWLGSSYRTGVKVFHNVPSNIVSRNALVMAAEYYINSSFRIGYSYDFDVAGLRSFNTHELSLGYYFMKKQESSMVSPRYF